MTVTQALIGPRHHGVVRFGLALPLPHVWSPDIAGLPPLAGGGVHLQFTDRLFGDTPEAAARAVAAIARRARITATLHDLPQRSDGRIADRRAAAYAEVITQSAGVAVSSEHERDLLCDIGVDVSSIAVIPLPIAPPAAARCRVTDVRAIGVFGFLYPGKGHDEVLDASADLPCDVEIHAIGEPSAGHDDLVDQLSTRAAAQGRRFRVTGHVDDDRLVDVLQMVAVPVVAHTHVSASGSLGSWLTAARRPVVATNRYTREIAHRNPGMLTLYPPHGLGDALKHALDNPQSTWLAADLVPRPTPADTADAYRDFVRRWHS
ncbi:glycosyltransferase family 4 protein [Mycolicibacterium sp. 018/SC-01/001]|uniref:glycosyltransferase family 4 protein n=1 Tax=Mycolicibacterium sp. 018/SC-01/001 TaxID=2592069 RepID=UPI00118071D0|nr:glycosyltransferase family 4 protein [Mycolicibacterium sp. 018/SC-01/001]TRW82797.1 glycosyltransferase family 4 protein [Mycolicibacterium sp. 018/SC-01/001]